MNKMFSSEVEISRFWKCNDDFVWYDKLCSQFGKRKPSYFYKNTITS